MLMEKPIESEQPGSRPFEQFAVADLDVVGNSVERQPILDRRQRMVPLEPGTAERRSGWGRRGSDNLQYAFYLAQSSGLEEMPAYVFDGYENRDPVSNYEQYVHRHFTEETDLEAAHSAWVLHGIGYYAMEFVNETALIKPQNYLHPDIDHARGPNIDYYANYEPNTPSTDVAAIRIASVPEGGTYLDLPTATMSDPYLSERGRELLRSVTDEGMQLKELGALSRRPGSSRIAVYELIRHIIHKAQGSNEVWFFNVVSTTANSFVQTYGANNFDVIGNDVSFEKDSRIKKDIVLRPTVVYPDKFIANILTACEEATTYGARRRLGKNFLFMTKGLDLRHMTPHMYTARQVIKAMLAEETDQQSA